MRMVNFKNSPYSWRLKNWELLYEIPLSSGSYHLVFRSVKSTHPKELKIFGFRGHYSVTIYSYSSCDTNDHLRAIKEHHFKLKNDALKYAKNYMVNHVK